MYRRPPLLRLLTGLILAVTVGLCLGAPAATAAPQPCAMMAGPASGGHMDDVTPVGGMAVCTSCNAVLPPSPKVSSIRSTAPVAYVQPADPRPPGAEPAPDPPIPRRKV